MGARFFNDNEAGGGTQISAGSSAKTMISVEAATATLCRGMIVAISVGPGGQPHTTDDIIFYDAVRKTDNGGTSTAATGNNGVRDGADVATRSVVRTNYSAESTVTTRLWSKSLNQRASQDWWADEGGALIWPATNLVGVAVRGKAPTYTNKLFGAVEYEDR